jgi:hypothetical protein
LLQCQITQQRVVPTLGISYSVLWFSCFHNEENTLGLTLDLGFHSAVGIHLRMARSPPLSGAPKRTSLTRSPGFLTNIRLGWTSISGANTLAH